MLPRREALWSATAKLPLFSGEVLAPPSVEMSDLAFELWTTGAAAPALVLHVLEARSIGNELKAAASLWTMEAPAPAFPCDILEASLTEGVKAAASRPQSKALPETNLG